MNARICKSHRFRAALALLCLLAAGWLGRPAATSTATTWEDLIAPIEPGVPVVAGYALSPPRRGAENDIVFTATRPDGAVGTSGRIELHIVRRGQWTGIRETASFGVAYETPKTTASAEDRERVTEALATALRRNDVGFGAPDTIALRGEPGPPTASRVLDRLRGLRGLCIAALVTFAMLALLTLPGGPWLCAVAVTGLGLALRLPALGLPFVHDQDVQRVFIGSLPLSEVLTGAGLRDRHPPLFFLVLHALGPLGSGEAIVRAPAALAGAAAPPALLSAAWFVRRRIGPAAVLAALAVAVSPVLVAHSREVSEIPLFSLIVIVLIAAVVRATDAPSRATLVVVGVTHALALWTYYLAPFVLLAVWATVLPTRRAGRALLVAAGAGIAIGVPSLIIGARTFLQDRGARQAAALYPDRAWGDNDPVGLASAMMTLATQAFGGMLLATAALYLLSSLIHRRSLGVIAPLAAAALTAFAISLLSPFARVQAYYVVTVLPLLALALALAPSLPGRFVRRGWSAVLAMAVVLTVPALLPPARLLYLPASDAFMPRFSDVMLSRPERTIVVVAHFDGTLLSYYLARAAGASIRGTISHAPDGIRFTFSDRIVVPLTRSHGLVEGSGERAARHLDALRRQGAILVIERHGYRLPEVSEALRSCVVLDDAPTARLLGCERRE